MNQQNQQNQHSYVACVRESTQNLPNIDSITPFGSGDEACLKEVGAVLKKHGASSRFGVNLLHSHFQMSEDEVLLEETDVANRKQIISVVKKASVPVGAIFMDRRLDICGKKSAADLYEEMRAYKSSLLINKLQNDMKLSAEEASELFEDVKRFVALCATSTQPLGLSKQIDQAWHIFILITKEYAKFCNDYCGRYIHHEPSDPFNLGKDYLAERQKTFSLASAAFGALSLNWNEPVNSCTHNCTNGD